MLSKAYQLAVKAHAGQVDKGGKPYIMHPLAVSELVTTEEEKIVALLHDVVEDTNITIEDLRREGFPEQVLAAVDALTKSPDVSYDDYIDIVKRNPIAVKVKISDMTHNSDLSRIANPTEKDRQRATRYRSVIRELKNI